MQCSEDTVGSTIGNTILTATISGQMFTQRCVRCKAWVIRDLLRNSTDPAIFLLISSVLTTPHHPTPPAPAPPPPPSTQTRIKTHTLDFKLDIARWMPIRGAFVLIESTDEYREEQLINSPPARGHLSTRFTASASNTNCLQSLLHFLCLKWERLLLCFCS